MTDKPRYDALREEAGFDWSVGAVNQTLLELTGTSFREFNLNPDAGIEMFRKGRPMIAEMYGPDMALPQVSIPAISYGHSSGLGAELIFPEDGEVFHEHLYSSLQEGIEALQKDVDFSTAGMAPFYLEYHRKLQEAFGGEDVYFWYNLEGPVTTAYTLRGDGIFYDMMDEPERFLDFLHLATDSILEFHRFRCQVMNRPVVNPDSGYLADDIAAMIPAKKFPELVLPCWEQYYRGVTTGGRRAHVEDLRPDQLEFLEEIGLSHYDPSISPKLNPRIIARRTRVPFAWRLGSFHYLSMDCQDIEDFVFQAVADGASRLFTYVEYTTMTTVEKVHAFIRAAREVERMLREGANRAAVGRCVSDEGREKFWDHWPE